MIWREHKSPPETERDKPPRFVSENNMSDTAILVSNWKKKHVWNIFCISRFERYHSIFVLRCHQGASCRVGRTCVGTNLQPERVLVRPTATKKGDTLWLFVIAMGHPYGPWPIYGWCKLDLWMIYGWFKLDLWTIYGRFMDDLWCFAYHFNDDVHWCFTAIHKAIWRFPKS